MAAVCITPTPYQRHRPDRTLIYKVIAESWVELLRQRAAVDRPLPGFVVKEFSEYLKCGLPEYGFTRLYCGGCRSSQVLAFSCKRRGFCPSCSGRRMHETSEHLMTSVLPRVPIRQWVLSLPWGLRYRLAHDAKLTSKILKIFVRAVSRCLGAKAKRKGELTGKLHTGSVTFIQRFGSALNLNVHFHVLFADGVFVEDTSTGKAEFRYTGEPSKKDLEWVLAQVSRRVEELLKEESEQEGFESDLSDLNKLSISMTDGYGENAGKKQIRFGVESDKETLPSRAVKLGGFSLHAGVSVGRFDREKLERIIRYTARGPVAQERLSFIAPGRLIYKLKSPWSDGTTHVSFYPLDFVARLVALIPPRGMNLIRYHGVFAPNSKLRPKIVPVSKAAKVEKGELEPSEPIKRSRLKWAEMLKRAFKIDVTICRVCNGRLEPIAVIKDPVAIDKILECLGERSEHEGISHLVRGPPAGGGSLYSESFGSAEDSQSTSDQRPPDW